MTELVSETMQLAQQGYSEFIETVISTLGEDPHQLEIEAPQKAWRFRYGTADVFVYLTGETEDSALLVWSPVITLPVKDDVGLMRFLLEKNWWSDTMEASFCIREDKVVLSTSRTLTDLNPGEVSRAITIVASLADEYDEILIEKFN